MTSDRMIRFGVIGVGAMGSSHCKNISSKCLDTQLVAVVDVDQKRAKEIGKNFNVPFFTDHHQMLAAGLCDAVIVATPHPHHADPAADSLRAGLHVMCEKPVSERISTARALVELAKSSGKAFTVNFPVRTRPESIKAIQLCRSGALGSLLRATLILPDYRTQAYYNSGGWRATWNGEGGGILMNQAPHFLDFFLQMTGMPEKLLGFTSTTMHEIEVEDSAEAILQFPNGCKGYIYATTNELADNRLIQIVGTRGSLTIDKNGSHLMKYDNDLDSFSRGATEKWATSTAKRTPFRKCKQAFTPFLNFVGHILRNEPLCITGESALASLEVANAIYLSSDKKDWVSLPLDGGMYDNFLENVRKNSTFVKKVADDNGLDAGLQSRINLGRV